MKKILFTSAFIICSILSYSQDSRYDFAYDTAGNQITANRFVYFEIDPTGYVDKNVSDSDPYQKFYDEDTFSYYPNPVQEELYLKWENKEAEIISSFKLFSTSWALLKEYNSMEQERQHVISFGDYPQGFYIVQILYTDGSVKSITVVKK